MSGVSGTPQDVDIDIAALFGSIWRRKLTILLVALLMAGAALGIATLISPRYQAETKILIETRESVFTRPDKVQGEDKSLDPESVASQIEIISSTALLQDVAEKLNLAGRSEFTKDTSLSIPFVTSPSLGTVEERVIRNMREKLKVYRVEGSRVIVVQFSSKDRELAARVPDAIADAYIALQENAKLDSDKSAANWLQPEIEKLRNSVKAAETRVADFRAANDIPVGQNNSALATQQLSELSTELTRVRASRAASEARAQSIERAIAAGGSVNAIPEVQTSSLIQRLIERQVQLRAEVADLSTTLLDNHPKIRSLRSQLDQLESQLRVEANKVLAGLRTESETARLRETELQKEVNRLKAESSRVGEEEVELRALEREAASQRDLLESYLSRFREAVSRNNPDYVPVNARVFAKAQMPGEPYFPKKLPITGAAFAAGLLLMTVFTLLGELFSGRAMRAARPAPAPAQQVAMPVSEAAARAAAAMAAKAPARPAHPGTGADELAARLINAGASRAIFVSPEGDEAAAASVMVARTLSDSGLRIILVDLTEASAAALPMLETRQKPGVTNLLAGDASFAEVIHGDAWSQCHVMPSGNGDAARAVAAIERLPIILDALANVYDLIVIECGPTDAKGIRRVENQTSEVVLSVINPKDEAVITAAEDLVAAGHGDLMIADAGRTGKGSARGRSAA
ncbi:MAG: exopolysaccharide transport family protein [Notoacmeibacter sp.]|nr:exopolysaccharide transport family protein [Notoacmeibacter sp.]MCC0031896.1 chain-length determining protein [Brucellaceae bacterium]